jgi:glycosyltransferase involved in cell wall biosynthesis
MKVLHVETGRQLYGGPQQLLYLLTGLRDEGVDQVLVCPEDAAIGEVAAGEGIKVRTLVYAGEHDLRLVFRLARILREEGSGLLHVHGRRGADTWGGFAAARAGIPAILSRRVDNPLHRWQAALLARTFARIVAISSAIADELVIAGISGEQIVRIPDSVDAPAFAREPDCNRFRRIFDLDDEAVVAGNVAQLIERKGHAYLLQAMASIKDRHPKLKLLVFGQGPLEDDLRRQVAELGLESMVTLAGFRNDLDDYLGCLDMVIHPALAEGMGVAVLKAGAAGVAVAAFAAGGVREAVINEETGLLVPAGDTEALAAAIARLANDPGLRDRLGTRARAHVAEHFSVDAMVKAHLALYASVSKD